MSIAFYSRQGERIVPVGVVNASCKGYVTQTCYLPGRIELDRVGRDVRVDGAPNSFAYLQGEPEYRPGLSGEETVVSIVLPGNSS